MGGWMVSGVMYVIDIYEMFILHVYMKFSLLFGMIENPRQRKCSSPIESQANNLE